MQVEGFAYGNEGGKGLAEKRAKAMRRMFEAEFGAQSISLGIATSGASISRFSPDQATVLHGTSVATTSDATRRVHIYLFHKRHSEGP